VQRAVLKAGGLPTVAGMLFTENSELVANAILLLGNLATSDECLVEIRKMECLQRIVDYMKSPGLLLGLFALQSEWCLHASERRSFGDVARRDCSRKLCAERNVSLRYSQDGRRAHFGWLSELDRSGTGGESRVGSCACQRRR
jgi:hypothetical protein